MSSLGVRRRVARFRRRVARITWRAALGPVSGTVHRQYVSSLAAGTGTAPGIADHVESVDLLAPAHIEHHAFADDLSRRFRRDRAYDDRHVYRLRDICASPRTGVCWLPGGGFMDETSGSRRQLLGWLDTALEEPLVGVRQTIPGPAVVLSSGLGFYHWLLADLTAALHALELVPDATVVVPREVPRYVDEAVELLGLTRVVRSQEPVRIEQLVVAARTAYSGWVPREDVEVVRRRLLPLVGRGGDEAIYVSRRLAERRPANEVELEQAFEGLGYRTVTAESLTFPEQIELFAGAARIAGTHGSGLANIVWSEPSLLTEVFVPWLFNDCYARLAVSLGADYRPYWCDPGPTRHGTAPVEEIATAEARAWR